MPSKVQQTEIRRTRIPNEAACFPVTQIPSDGLLGGAFAWATTGYRSPSARYVPVWRRFILKLKRK